MNRIFGKTKHIHFIGIGGIGMSGMAEFLYNHGFDISGSDINKSCVRWWRASGHGTILSQMLFYVDM